MKTVSLQFDSLKFIPVQNLKGELFAYDVALHPLRLLNSEDNSLFTCYSIDHEGKLTDKESIFRKEELQVVWVRTS